jgi:AcrR family transcriptional regulator
MGLRETKAARTKQRILDEALTLFDSQGYEATTIEQIAAAAEVGTSTLYRFYGGKEAILMAPLAVNSLAATLRERPTDEPLDLALAASIRTVMDSHVQAPRVLLARKIVDRSPVPRAALWDLIGGAQSDVERLVAERLGKDAGDIDVVMTAAAAIQIIGLIADRWRADPSRPAAEHTEEMLRQLASLRLVLPASDPGTQVGS